MWDAPLDDGDRSDTFYTVIQNVTDMVYATNNTSIMLTDLIPSVYYGLRITTDNGVSSQDSNVEIRTVNIPTVMTLKGGMCLSVCIVCSVCVYVCLCACECMVLNQTWEV